MLLLCGVFFILTTPLQEKPCSFIEIVDLIHLGIVVNKMNIDHMACKVISKRACKEF